MPMGSLEEQLRPQLLSGLAYERLLEEIISGRLPPGHRLRLDLLAHSWSVSRTPVREALQRLADLRLVHVSPNAGTRVAEWTIHDMIERAEIIGRLLAIGTLDTVTRRSADAAAAPAIPLTLPSMSGCELTDYLDVAGFLIEREFGRLGERVVRDYAEPLRLFLAAETMHRHGVDLEPGRERRRALLGTALGSIRRDDPAAAHRALAALSAAVVEALESAPGTSA